MTSGDGEGAGRLRDREVAFAGGLASMTQREASQRVSAAGGRVVRQPGAATAYLVVGHGGWPLDADGRPSSSMARARRLKEQRTELQVVSETTFLEILGLTDQLEDLQRLFTTAQLSRILEVPVREIRAWMRRKLIRPVKVARRLAWFDFREVAMARALHTLTSAGVSPARIGRSIRELSQWLPDAERMLTQLETLAPGHILSVRLPDGSLADPGGQRLFDFHRGESGAGHHEAAGGTIRAFAPAPRDGSVVNLAAALGLESAGAATGSAAEPAVDRAGTATGAPGRPDPGSVFDLGAVAGAALAGAGPDALFQRGVLAEDAGQWELAQYLYERALAVGGPDPETCFNLGNVLYELDQKRAAAQRYLEAVAQDSEYVESLNNLGNALAETGWLNEAAAAYRRALRLEPAYADAHSNLAETLVYLGRYEEARFHWTSYLAIDPHSSWAQAIRELLRNLPADRN